MHCSDRLGKVNVILLAILSAASCLATGCGPSDGSSSADRVPEIDTLQTRASRTDGLTELSDSVGGISDVLPISDRVLLVADPVTPTVWRLDPDSDRIRRLTRVGSGPGELRSVWSIGLARGGPWAWDFGSSRLVWLTPDSASSLRLRIDRIVRHSEFVARHSVRGVLNDGRVVSRVGKSDCVLHRDGFPFCDFAVVGLRDDSLTVRSIARARGNFGREIVPTPGNIVSFQPFPLDPVVEGDPWGRGVVTLLPLIGGDSAQVARSRIDVWQTNFQEPRPEILTWRTVPTEEIDLEPLLDELVASDRYVDQEDVPSIRETIEREHPAVVPPFVDVRIARDGQVWVEVNPVLTDVPTWLGITGCGEPWPMLRLPEGSDLMAVAPGRAWVVTLDDMDVARLTRFEWTPREPCGDSTALRGK